MVFRKRSVCRVIFLICFLIVHVFIGINFYYMSADTIKGDFSAEKVLVKTRYYPMRIPENKKTIESNATNRISADFAQIYFSARYNQSLAYSYETDDPWRRPSRYAPLVHYFYKYTFCRLQYGYASFLNILLQLFLFYFSLFYVLKKLNISKYFLGLLLISNIILFFTPVGLSWFERGQFSLFVATSYLWLIIGIIKSNRFYVLTSALFAFIKWTSFPFIFVVFILSFLNAKNYYDFKKQILNAVVFSITIILLFSLLFFEGINFLHGIIEQEKDFTPQELSLSIIIPISSINIIQVSTCIFIGYVLILKYKSHFLELIPYIVAVSIILLTYPTLSHDYSVPSMLGLLPFQIYLYKNTRETYKHEKCDNFFKHFYYNWLQKYFHLMFFLLVLVFIISASFFGVLLLELHLKGKYLIYYYLFYFILLTVICFFYKGNRFQPFKKSSVIRK